ncbi:MAG: hypothetical protein MJZ70_04055 [Bacteroidales bacterium]|nr:hypothetical protein [Bacteroidales bacterium]
MKKIAVLAALLSAVMFAFTGCEKEELLFTKGRVTNTLSPELQELYKKMPKHDYGKISVVGDGILQFESVEQYEKVCDILQEECETWSDLFYEKYGVMEEDELLEWEAKCGFDEFLPIVFFEASLGVSGRMLYDQQKEVMQKWVDSEFKGESPSDPIFIFESEQAVHTIYHEVCIQDTIFQFRTDALVRCPLKELKVWEDIRMEATELLPADIVFIEKGPDVIEPDKKYFVCRGYGELNNRHMSVIAINDKSEYEVVGRRHINNKYTMKSKLTNYKYKKANNNGGYKYKKVKRSCSIITTNQTFFTEQYHKQGIFSQTYVGEIAENVTAAMPGCKNKKSVTGTVEDGLKIFDISYWQPWKFEAGVYQYPTLSIVIDGQRLDMDVTLH